MRMLTALAVLVLGFAPASADDNEGWTQLSLSTCGVDSFLKDNPASDGRGGTDTATVSVTVSPIADISIIATDAAKPEGDSGATPFSFTVSLDEAAAGTVTVDWAVAGVIVPPPAT